MNEYLHWILLYVIGCIAGFINVMAGGGSTITMPILIFLGLDGATANGTNRVALFIQNIFAISSFHAEKSYHFRQSLTYALWTLPGAIIGAIVAVRIENELFQKLLGIVIIGVMITVLLPSRNPMSGDPSGESRKWLIYPALFGIGFYGGFIQAGVGFFIMAAFLHILNLNLVQINMHKVFIIFIYTIPAILVFALAGNIRLIYALVLAAGNATGAWFSAKISVRKGDKVIRIVLFIAVLAMALKLFNVY